MSATARASSAGEPLLRKPSPLDIAFYLSIWIACRNNGIREIRKSEKIRDGANAGHGGGRHRAAAGKATPLVAVVRLRKRNEWVLPKGKLDRGETPRAAAEREVMEETGHAVAVHEFLGTLVYEARGGSKVVHYWRMEAGEAPVRKLMRDVRAVDWLPLGEAVERLSRGYERAFLENVGPIALGFGKRMAATYEATPPVEAIAEPGEAALVRRTLRGSAAQPDLCRKCCGLAARRMV